MGLDELKLEFPLHFNCAGGKRNRDNGRFGNTLINVVTRVFVCVV